MGQTEEEIKQYPGYATRIGLVETAFAFVTPLTGTVFFDNMFHDGLINENDLAKFDYLHPVVNSNKISKDRLIQLLGYCYGYFYSRKKLAEGQKFYLDVQPSHVMKDASSNADLGLFALKALNSDIFSVLTTNTPVLQHSNTPIAQRSGADSCHARPLAVI